jgi:hypothetical protein
VLLNAHTTVYARQNKPFTAATHLTPEFSRNANSGCHRDLSGEYNIALGQFFIFMNYASSKLEKPANSVERDFLVCGVRPHTFPLQGVLNSYAVTTMFLLK